MNYTALGFDGLVQFILPVLFCFFVFIFSGIYGPHPQSKHADLDNVMTLTQVLSPPRRLYRQCKVSKTRGTTHPSTQPATISFLLRKSQLSLVVLGVGYHLLPTGCRLPEDKVTFLSSNTCPSVLAFQQTNQITGMIRAFVQPRQGSGP